MADFAYFFDGVEADLLGLDSATIRRSASQAINKITRDTRTDIAREVRSQVNLPASYVAPSQDRLYVSRTASPAQLESEITARGRATSLARFVTGSRKPGRSGVAISVSPGSSTILKRAFLLPLRRGLGPSTDGLSNLGLAIRLRKGESLSKSTSAKQIGNRLFLLYGPSVAQVFENNAGSGIKSDTQPETERRLATEFLRLINREFNA